MKPNGLIVAGLIVSLIGVFIVIRHTLDIPRYWTPLFVGVALILAGAIWSMLRSKSGAS